MKANLLQNVYVNKHTAQNRLPNFRARMYLTNYIRERRAIRTSSYLRASLGFLRRTLEKRWNQERRHAFRAVCFLSGRSRGTSQRYTVARTKIRALVASTQLLGVQKSS